MSIVYTSNSFTHPKAETSKNDDSKAGTTENRSAVASVQKNQPAQNGCAPDRQSRKV